MISKTSKAVKARVSEDLSAQTVEQARELLAATMEPDTKRGILKISGERYILTRPEIIVNIQRQLEQTVGASTKGFLYLAGERSAGERLHIVRTVVPDADLVHDFDESARRIIDAIALTGWGRYRLLSFDRERGVIRFALENSAIAQAYGPSPKPVCHLVAGWLAGVARRLLGRDFLCEEAACKSQGRPRCEFELNPMPRHMR